MTTPNDDGYDTRRLEPMASAMVEMLHDKLRERDARIEALIAERDAAVAIAEAGSGPNVEIHYEEGIEEGERRAVAAIVAWLRKTNGIASNGVVRTAAAIACAIERRDHITEDKP